MRVFASQDPNINTVMTASIIPAIPHYENMLQQQQSSKYPRKTFNQPISNKSNTQYQLDLRNKNENTVKINKLPELFIHDEPKVYYTLHPVDFKQRDPQSINANLPLIQCKRLSMPIRTRQFLLSTYTETNAEIKGHSKIGNNSREATPVHLDDPIYSIIQSNQSKFPPLKFNGDDISVSEDGLKVEIVVQNSDIPSSLKKRPLESIDTYNGLPLMKKKHKYDIPLENSRTISAKEVLRMVDSSLISSDMDLSQNNSTSTSMVLNESNTPLKTIPSYLKYFNNGTVLAGDTPLKNLMSSSTPQPTSRFLNIQDEDVFKYSPLTGSKLKNL